MNKKELIASALDTHLADKNAIRRAVLTAPAPKKSFWRPFLASAAALCVCVAVALGILNLPREEPDIPFIPGVSNSSGTTGTTISPTPTEPVLQEDRVKYFNYFLKNHFLTADLFSGDEPFPDDGILHFCMVKLRKQTGRSAFSVQEIQDAAKKYFGRTLERVEPNDDFMQIEGTDLLTAIGKGYNAFGTMILKSITRNADGSTTAVFLGFSPIEDTGVFGLDDASFDEACRSGNQRLITARNMHHPSMGIYLRLHFTEKEDEYGMYLQYHSITRVMPTVPAPEGIPMLRKFPLGDSAFGYVITSTEDITSTGEGSHETSTEFQIITYPKLTICDGAVSPPKLYDSFLNAAEQVKQEWKTDPTTGNPLYLKAQLAPIFLTDSVCSFSISGSANATGAAYPQNVYRTFTYDTVTGQQLRLANLCEISPQLVSLYRRRFREQAPEEQANLLDRYTDEQLLEELRNADQTGSLLQSYLTTDGIGIVFPTGDNMDQRIQTIL